MSAAADFDVRALMFTARAAHHVVCAYWSSLGLSMPPWDAEPGHVRALWGSLTSMVIQGATLADVRTAYYYAVSQPEPSSLPREEQQRWVIWQAAVRGAFAFTSRDLREPP